MNFNELINEERIVRAITDMGFEKPTEIQEKSIEMIHQGIDMIGQSQTGTGKTAAFTIPVLEKIDPKNKKTQVLILCPTRELSVQVAGEFRKIAKYMQGIRTVSVFGGEPIYKQINEIKKGAQVIVGTPGRLMDHMNRRTIKFDDLHTVILDEADEMLKMGFREDIELILGSVEHKTQKVMFSATMPKEIHQLAKKFLDEPGNIKIESKGLTTKNVTQEYCAVKPRYKKEALYRLIDANTPERCIVFCNTKRMVDEITDALQERGYWSDKIHGDLKQELRLSVLAKFNAGIINVLVATDVAARGLDIQNVDLVLNYDVPEKEDYYVHRIGRTGRASNTGRSITLASHLDRMRMRNIEYYIKKKIDRIPVPSVHEVNEARMERFIEQTMENMNQEVLDHYAPIIQKIIQKGYSVDILAAALLKDALSLHDMVEEHDINDHQFTLQNRRNDRDRNRNDRGRGRDGNREGNRDRKDRGNDRNGRSDRAKSNRSGKGQTRLFLSVGKVHNATVKDLLGAIAGECNVDGRSIGAIDMYDKFSFVDVEEQHVKKILKQLQNKRIKGRKINVEIAKK